MKNLWFLGIFVFSMFLIGCSEKGKEKEELSQNKEEMMEKTDAKTPDQTEMQMKENQKKEMADVNTEAAFQEKVKKGEIIMMTDNGEPESFKFEGSKISAMKLPDGKLHQVRKDGDRNMINVPGKGEMGIIMLNDKFYLFDNNDQAYELKFDKKQLYAEKTDLTDVVLSKK